jgi:signal peptide peptidase SppA
MAKKEVRERCIERHVGPWGIEIGWLQEAIVQIKAGTWPILTSKQIEARRYGENEYFVDRNGIAFISLDGPLMKGWSKYGGTSTMAVRKQLRAINNDVDVKGVMLLVDSPGGTVAGTEELAEDVAKTNKQKPVFAYVEDLAASAAYWVASQADRITASPTSEVGSIGTVAVVEDFSGRAEQMGIKVHVVSTGAYKGMGVPGTEILSEYLAYVKERVNDLNEFFMQAVERGRNLQQEDFAKYADGRVFIAEKARAAGLIDGVERVEDAVSSLLERVRPIDNRADVRIKNLRLNQVSAISDIQAESGKTSGA